MILADASDDVQPAAPVTVEEKRERARDLLGQATLKAYGACSNALDGAGGIGDTSIQGAVKKNMAVAQQRLGSQSEKIDDVVNGRLAFAKWNNVTDALLSEAITAWEAVEDANSLTAKASAALDKLGAQFRNVFSGMNLAADAVEQSNWQKVWSAIRDALHAALDFLRDVAKAVGDILKEILGAVGSAVGGVLTSVLLPIGALAIGLIFVLPKLLDSVGRNAESVGKGIKSAKGLGGYRRRSRRRSRRSA